MQLTSYEQVLYNLRMRHDTSPGENAEEWVVRIGLPELLDMSAAAAIALSRHCDKAGDERPTIVTARRVVWDILHDLELIRFGEEGCVFSGEENKHFLVLREYHRRDPFVRHCRDEEARNIAAAGILPLVKCRTLSDIF